MSDNKKLILAVATDGDGNYSVDIPAGSNAAETAFAMAVVIRCLVKDNVIDNADMMLNLISKYSKEAQYDPIN